MLDSMFMLKCLIAMLLIDAYEMQMKWNFNYTTTFTISTSAWLQNMVDPFFLLHLFAYMLDARILLVTTQSPILFLFLYLVRYSEKWNRFPQSNRCHYMRKIIVHIAYPFVSKVLNHWHRKYALVANQMAWTSEQKTVIGTSEWIVSSFQKLLIAFEQMSSHIKLYLVKYHYGCIERFFLFKRK